MQALPEHVTGFVCVSCGRSEERETKHLTCPACGENLDVQYDLEQIARKVKRESIEQSREPSIWRYHPLLPLSESSGPPPLRVGGTALIRSERLGRQLGLSRLDLKDDTTNPTASFKDRASLVAALRGREMGVATVATASTGNAASSLAGIAAALGMKCVIFVPENAPIPKLTQMLLYGAEVYRVRGSYDDAFDLCARAVERFGWYTRSTGVNPFTVEGKKTAAFEIAEALRWDVPDWVVVPTGDGNILGGVGKGFRQLLGLGWTEKMPRLVAVQAEGAGPIARAFQRGERTVEPEEALTVADSISVGRPRDATRALRTLFESNGAAVTVSDEEILRAMRDLPRETGLFAEPSAAASLAGLRKLLEENVVTPSVSVCLMITGNGLKDVATASKLTTPPPLVEADLADLEKAVAGRGDPADS